MSTFWSAFIIILVLINIVGACWLLMATRKGGSTKENETLGHDFDGIQEYNNPLPQWWLWLFYITIAYGVGYMVVYPGFGGYAGLWNWSQTKQWEEEVAKAEAKYLPMYQAFSAKSVEEVAKDPKAVKMGQHIFANVCFGCHGSDAGGLPGYPNLRDNDWLYGGSGDAIKTSILQGRSGMMPGMGAILGDDGVNNVANYVLSLSGREHDSQKAEAGKTVFNTQCFACHGMDGKGNPLMGAPNLTDNVWLYGGRLVAIKESIAKGRQGIMPEHATRLGEDRAHVVAAYVYSLSQEKSGQAK